MYKASIVTLDHPDARALALRCSQFRKLHLEYAHMFAAMAEGQDAHIDDFTAGIFAAMRCTITSAGQSAVRRASAEQVQALWEIVHGALDGTKQSYVPGAKVKQLGRAPDLRNREQVERWLAS